MRARAHTGAVDIPVTLFDDESTRDETVAALPQDGKVRTEGEDEVYSGLAASAMPAATYHMV